MDHSLLVGSLLESMKLQQTILNHQIESLQTLSKNGVVAKVPRRQMSVAARKRIAAAQKKRWKEAKVVAKKKA